MADAIFEHPRLAEIYDLLDTPAREDLDPYLAMTEEFGARSVVDLGCGTGVLACRLAGRGKNVTGVDPAAASLSVARRRANAGAVTWLHGTAVALPPLQVDLVTMTGNVAQVFVEDEEWRATLRACSHVLRPGGRLVFETRDPSRQAWKSWTREQSHRSLDIPGMGTVETWVELIDVELPLVSFRHTFVFQAEDTVITSDSTLRFRDRHEVIDTLADAGFGIETIRDAPDRPGLEFVFVARWPT